MGTREYHQQYYQQNRERMLANARRNRILKQKQSGVPVRKVGRPRLTQEQREDKENHKPTAPLKHTSDKTKFIMPSQEELDTMPQDQQEYYNDPLIEHPHWREQLQTTKAKW